jgi:hypothetical protein
VRASLLLLGGLLLAQPALANVGLPILAVTWPGAWLLLVPVVLVEALVARWVLASSWRQSLKLAAWANVASTLLAVPLSWLLPFLPILLIGGLARSSLPSQLQAWLLILGSPFWLPPMADSQTWLIPLAAAFLCLPAYAASVWIERLVGSYVLRPIPTASMQRWAWIANRITTAPSLRAC